MKKSTVILFFVCIISTAAIAQNIRIDSLKQVIETSENDTSRIRAISSLRFYYTWANPDSALIYAHEALLLSNKFDSDFWKASALTGNSVVLSVMGNYSQALNLALNAKRLGEEVGNQHLLYNIYTALCLIYRDQGDFKNAIHNAFEILKITRTYENSVENVTALGHIGSVYEKFDQLDSAIIYIKKAYEIDNKINWKWSLLPNTMGNIYEKMGKYDLAIQYYKEGIVIAKDQNVIRDLVDMYNGVANIFLKTGQIDSCIYYAKQIINISTKTSYPLSAMEASHYVIKYL